jgi:hypothetical protein
MLDAAKSSGILALVNVLAEARSAGTIKLQVALVHRTFERFKTLGVFVIRQIEIFARLADFRKQFTQVFAHNPNPTRGQTSRAVLSPFRPARKTLKKRRGIR